MTNHPNNQMNLVQGLSSDEARRRLKQHGANVLPAPPALAWWRRFLDQFRSPLIYLLLFALVIDLLIWLIKGHSTLPLEAFAITTILLLNAGLGVYQEDKAEAALSRLKSLAASFVWVFRDGQLVHAASADLVPGDVVRVDSGDRIPADGLVTEAHGLMIDESIVTGESLPVEKTISDALLSGTLLTRGKGYMEVTRTGAASTAGNLAAMIGAIEAEKTPLERRLAKFGDQVARWILLLSMLVATFGLFVEGFSRIGHVLLFAVALAVAAVPEGLPAVLTLTLALGVERMAKKRAVVRRLSAVEALGSVTVIATDKTGTLTENRMHVKDVDSSHTELALRAMVLANDAEDGTGAGDPLELALLDFARSQADIAKLIVENPRHSLQPFDSTYKFMRVTVEENGRLASYLKGAPEVLLERSELPDAERRSWEEKAQAYALEGFKVLAFARRPGEGDTGLTFLGLALLWDPPRAEVRESIHHANDAGLRVIMITGDHPATAAAVANEIGIPPGRVITGLDLETLSPAELGHEVKSANVFARVAPQDKLRLVEALKRNGEIVAVTGDGVNDAPALKCSDVGVAMGLRGSDVSREVADLVLLDDNFATIVTAIREGRNIYENIQKFIRFLFCANFALTLIVIFGALGSFWLGFRDPAGGLLLPLTAMQLLWINVITNGPPALALALDRNHGLMIQPPREPQSPLLDGPSLRFIFIAGSISALIGGLLLVILPRCGYQPEASRTLLFAYATLSQLLMAYSARRIITVPRVNIALHITVAICLVVQLLTLFVPGLRVMLGLVAPDMRGLLLTAGAILLSWITAEVYVRTPALGSFAARQFKHKLNLNLGWLRRIVVAIVGSTVVVIGLALLVLPGPAFVVIPLGLAILATEFVWARAMLKKARSLLPSPRRQNDEALSDWSASVPLAMSAKREKSNRDGCAPVEIR
jgi:Ca2+-transporting ATPase